MIKMVRPRKLPVKLRLGRAGKQNRSIPAWIIVRTRGHVKTHPKRRKWRGHKINP